MATLYWFIVVALLHSPSLGSGPCSDYGELENAQIRGSDVVTDPNNIVCDRRVSPGWYRMGPEGLHNQCPQFERCSTNYPVWMDDTLPLVTEGVKNIRACVVELNDCCVMNFTIRTQMCERFPVFYLGEWDALSCSWGYCFEKDPETTTAASTTQDTGIKTSAKPHNNNLLTVVGIAVGVSVAVLIIATVLLVLVCKLVLKQPRSPSVRPDRAPSAPPRYEPEDHWQDKQPLPGANFNM